MKGVAWALLCCASACGGLAQGASLAEKAFEKALAAYRDREFDLSRQQAAVALELDPSHPGARACLARSLVQLDRIPEALHHVEALMERGGGEPRALYEAVEILESLSASRFARLQRLAPDSAEAHELLGKHHEAFGRHEQAAEEYRLALKRGPERPGVRFLIGNIAWKMRAYDEALGMLLDEIERNPHHAAANHRIGNIHLFRNEAEKALPYLEKAVAADAEFFEARRDLGKAYREAGRLDEALEQLHYVAERLPEDDRIHAQLAAVYRAQGDRERAAEAMRTHQRILQQRFDASQQRNATSKD